MVTYINVCMKQTIKTNWDLITKNYCKNGESLKDLIYRYYIVEKRWPKTISNEFGITSQSFNRKRRRFGINGKRDYFSKSVFTKQEVIDYLISFNLKNNRPPTTTELSKNNPHKFPTKRQIYRYFGSYNDLLKSIGLKTYYEIHTSNNKWKGNKKLRFFILKRDNFTCQYCGRGIKDGIVLQVDHILPKSKGGKDIKENLKTSCRDCNQGKKDVLL